MRPHNWAFDDLSVFEQVFGNLIEETGAVIMGRRRISSTASFGSAFKQATRALGG